MKKMKCLLAGVLVAFSASAFAQDMTADLARMESVISKSATPLNPKKDVDLKNFDKLYKKDPVALSKLARLFYEYDDTANARAYAQKSIALVEKKSNIECGEGYIVIGDIFYVNGDPGEAAGYYELAKIHDPKNPRAYEKVAGVYRKVDPDGAVRNLKELEDLDPSYPADAVAAGFYYDAMKWGKAREYFKKVDESKLREEDFQRYAYIEYYYNDYKNCIRIADLGLSKFPTDVTCNRYKMFCLTTTKDFAAAVAAADKLFNCPKYKEYAVDYKFYAQALLGVGQSDKALEALDKSLALKADQPDLNKVRADIYLAKGENVKGLELLEQYVLNNEDARFADYLELTMKLDTVTVDEATHVAFLKKEDALLAQMLTKFPGQQLKYIYFKRAHINQELDPEATEGLAIPHYEAFIELMKKEDASNSMVINAAKYVANYYIAKGDEEKAKQFVELIPEEE